MTKNKNKKVLKKNRYNPNNINDFTKKGIYETLFSNMYIFDYKFIMYWLPSILYVLFISLYIVGVNDESEFSVGFISCLIIFMIYFIIDIVYQHLLCKNVTLSKKIYNSVLNSLTPSIFVLIGYVIGKLLRDVRSCDQDSSMSGMQTAQYVRRNDDLYNIHRNNIIVALIFYIFSIFYSNPINKKKCINNRLC